ncbi:MAG: protein kinase [Bryobacteraceae bacterium]
MTQGRWARVSALFQKAVELPAGAERDAWLEETCGGDATLRRNVERLLSAYGEPSLESPVERLAGVELELAPGEMLGHYRVEAKIGQGGMGIVYRGFDTKLHRLVALKVLPPFYTNSEERKQRLLREARAASMLNHPNIVTVHEVGSDQDVDFIAMEHIDGCGLQERIGVTGMPVAELVRYALQITDALAAAHAMKVLHRDIKPTNIMVTRDDRIKVLDFGLARFMEPGEHSPQQTLTGQEFVRGTPAYMSPEQAEGKKLDGRSDIFSVGCVLYQMATGRRPFEGGSHISVMYKVTNEPARRPTELAALPVELERVILRCLEKDAAKRFASMGELKAALEGLDVGARAKRTNPAARRMALIVAGAVVLAGLGWGAWRVLQRSGGGGVRRTVKFAITPSNLLRGGLGEVDSEVSISRDGKHIAYVESHAGQLWIRDIDSERARPVEGATAVYQVFWSPDNQWIGYSSGQGCGSRPGCDLMKVRVSGGATERIVKMAGSFKRASWSADGRTIVYCDSLGMYVVAGAGGEAKRIVEHSHIEHPSILDLPDGRRAFLYQAMDGEQPSHAIYVQVEGEKRRLVKVSESTNPYPAWSTTGHVIYVDGPNYAPSIWALPFSLERLEATGKAFQIVESGSAPMLSATGTMVYGDPPSNRLQLSWVDRAGKSLSRVGEARMQSRPVLSPDGREVAVVSREPGWDLVVYDAERGTVRQFTSDARSEALGAWNGDAITYVSFTTKEWVVVSKGKITKEWLRSPVAVSNPQWSADGRYLLYGRRTRESQGDVMYRERRGEELGEEKVFVRSAAQEGDASFSADGRLVAYFSDESGRNEVYVREFPDGKARRVSRDGGNWPRWRRDGRELLFASGGN